MRRLCCLLALLVLAPTAQAWNAAGHRLTGLLAWVELSPPSRQMLMQALRQHPDAPRWHSQSGTGQDADVFAEATVWADTLRHDPRFYDERRDTPTPQLPGYHDMARHTRWHYIDLDTNGQVQKGELDRALADTLEILRSTIDLAEFNHALLWWLHLVGDAHQPFHVGHAHDAGGTQVGVEWDDGRRDPYDTLHNLWDTLPGPSSLRGKKLHAAAQRLVGQPTPTPSQPIDRWLQDSHALLGAAYPDQVGGLLWRLTPAYMQRARTLAEQQLRAAGFRLGESLETVLRARVSRGTPPPRPQAP